MRTPQGTSYWATLTYMQRTGVLEGALERAERNVRQLPRSKPSSEPPVMESRRVAAVGNWFYASSASAPSDQPFRALDVANSKSKRSLLPTLRFRGAGDSRSHSVTVLGDDISRRNPATPFPDPHPKCVVPAEAHNPHHCWAKPRK